MSFVCQLQSILAQAGVCEGALHCSHLLPVKRDAHRGRHSEIMCVCVQSFPARVCVCCVCMCACVCVCFLVGRQYLLDQTSSGSSVNSMASRHTETQPAEHIYCNILLLFKHVFTVFLYTNSSSILLSYLGMLSSCELSVALLTLQTQRVVVPA